MVLNMPHKANQTSFKKGHLGIREKDNYMWKGDSVGKKALHIWIRLRLIEPENCPNCGKVETLDLANKTGKYLRDLSDWEYLCRRCHMESDGRMDALLKGTGVSGKMYRGTDGRFRNDTNTPALQEH